MSLQSTSVDDEWESFLHSSSSSKTVISKSSLLNALSVVEPVSAKLGYEIGNACEENNHDLGDQESLGDLEAPECGKLHISTKTKVLFLNCEIDTVKTFWSIPVIDYWRPIEGVVKKQIKITSNTEEEFEEMQQNLQACGQRYIEMMIKNSVTPQGAKKLKFKDDRKITIGISKKDIMNCRGKQKKAFMNCFAIIIRFKFMDEFREVHVKVFNTGKLEIPGVPDDDMLAIVREKVIQHLSPHLPSAPQQEVAEDSPNISTQPLQYIRKGGIDDGDEDVLINSGFHCGFCINQIAFYGILKSDKYGVETSYDSCHYPGIRCKYYYRNHLPADHPDQNGRIGLEDNGIKLSQLELSKKYTCVSFMIFSTGNCLVVGNCSKSVLLHVFEFIRQMLKTEYKAIAIPNESVVTKLKKKKQRKKTVSMNSSYYNAVCSY